MNEEPLPIDQQAESATTTPAAQAAADLAPAECAAQLAQRFPALFAAATPQPLKLRIQADIQLRAPGIFTKQSLSAFLHRHTTSTAYLKALVAATHRVDLDGQAAGEVSEEHREAARDELARRRALHDARRAAEREAQRKAQDDARRSREAEDAARQERAVLLRAYESTTLTVSNFCALKGIAEAGLDAMLAQARLEREQRPRTPAVDLPSSRPGGQKQRPDQGRPSHRRPRSEHKPSR